MRTGPQWLLTSVSAMLLLWLAAGVGSGSSAGLGTASANTAPQQAAASPSATPGCQLAWQWVETPSNEQATGLFGVAAVSHNDVWAISSLYPGIPLMEHWDGQSWQFVSVPSPGQYGELNGLAALASDNIWMVGGNTSAYTTLIEHWDGSQWSVVPSPSPNQDSELYSVAAISADDIWAVGYTTILTNQIGVDQTLTEHWDGTSWSVVPSPNINPSGGLQPNGFWGVAASASNDVWAVGNYYENQDGVVKGLTEHWDGSSWSIVAAPFIGNRDQLWAVSALAANDAWAVGNYHSGTVDYLLALHWDGSSWQPVPVPYPDIATNGLRGIVALASNNVWAVGDYYDQNLNNRTLIEHWDGSSWQQVPSVSDQYADHLHGIAAVSPDDMWAVGHRTYGPPPDAIAEHYGCISPTTTLTAAPTDTPAASATPTVTLAPSSTATPAASVTPPTTATNTATPSITPTPQNTATPTLTHTPPATASPVSATNTPTRTATPLNTATPGSTATPLPVTATPTDCPNPFVDISGNIFYAAIHYLNCRGVINGTDASHYSPAGTATRGQFAKIVVLGFGLPLVTPTNGQTFTDVPPGYFAYLYIESGYHAGILSGFDAASCAAAGAIYPCYLPNRAITRAQLTKLVVNAAHYPLFTPTGGQQTFSDVPPSNVFFVSIETAHAHGVVNGYPDGTFRPNQSIRRDEMAQIVYKGITTP